MSRYFEDADPHILHITTGHFHEEAGYGTLRRQGSRSWLLILTLDGQGRFRHRDGQTTCGPGDAALLRPSTMHEYGVAHGAQNWELLWAHFHPRPHWAEFLDWPAEGPGLSVVHLGDAFPSTEAAMQRANLAQDDLLAMAALEEALIRCWRVASPNQRRLRDDRIRRIVADLSVNLRLATNLEELARRVNLSPSRLSHLFVEELGVTPRAYAERLRIDRARQLLEHTGLSIREIAAEIGFESEFYFSNRFRKSTGVSPTAWRSEHRRSS